MSKIGTADIKGIMLGSTEIVKAYLGTDIVYQNNAPLPYDAQVEYLESTGSQYIDTGVVGSSNLAVKLTCYYQESSSSLPTYGFVFGSRIANNNKQYGLIHSYAGNFRYGNKASNSWSNTQGRILVFDNTASHKVLKVYDIDNNLVTTLTATAATFNNSLNIYLFGNNNNGSVTYGSHKIYAMQLYNGSTLVRDYIPVRIGQVGYMYDKVSKQLFGNSGTGNFILGADKN